MQSSFQLASEKQAKMIQAIESDQMSGAKAENWAAATGSYW